MITWLFHIHACFACWFASGWCVARVACVACGVPPLRFLKFTGSAFSSLLSFGRVLRVLGALGSSLGLLLLRVLGALRASCGLRGLRAGSLPSGFLIHKRVVRWTETGEM